MLAGGGRGGGGQKVQLVGHLWRHAWLGGWTVLPRNFPPEASDVLADLA